MMLTLPETTLTGLYPSPRALLAKVNMAAFINIFRKLTRVNLRIPQNVKPDFPFAVLFS